MDEPWRIWMHSQNKLGPRQSTTRADPQLGSASIALYSLADPVLHHNWLSLLNDEAARPYKDSGLEVFQLLVSCLEFHLDD